jgi:hypothetical protein
MKTLLIMAAAALLMAGCAKKEGCTDPKAKNYDSKAKKDDGNCELPVKGCTNSKADNYSTGAEEDDGSCVYTDKYVLYAGSWCYQSSQYYTIFVNGERKGQLLAEGDPSCAQIKGYTLTLAKGTYHVEYRCPGPNYSIEGFYIDVENPSGDCKAIKIPVR